METGGKDETSDAASLRAMKAQVDSGKSTLTEDANSVGVSSAALPSADNSETPAPNETVVILMKTQKNTIRKYLNCVTSSMDNKTHRTELHRTASIHSYFN